jgi:plastocyanin
MNVSMRRRRSGPARRFALLVALAALIADCSGVDEGSVREIGSEGTGSGSASASGSGSGSASASGSSSAVAAAEQECAPVGEDLEPDADQTVDLELIDYGFEPEEITVDAGVVTFATTNAGGEAHELAFLPRGGDVPMTDDGAPDEAALEDAGAFELEAYGPGQDCNATYELEPGTYTLFSPCSASSRRRTARPTTTRACAAPSRSAERQTAPAPARVMEHQPLLALLPCGAGCVRAPARRPGLALQRARHGLDPLELLA